MNAPSGTALVIGTTTARVPGGRAGVITLRRVTCLVAPRGYPGAGREILTGIPGIPVHLVFSFCTEGIH